MKNRLISILLAVVLACTPAMPALANGMKTEAIATADSMLSPAQGESPSVTQEAALPMEQETTPVAESFANADADILPKPTVTPKKTVFTYTGKKITPSLTVKDGKKSVSKKLYEVALVPGDDGKTVGTHTVLVSFKSPYTGIRTVDYKINPKKTSISSIKADSTTATVKIKTQKTETSGYEIAYSTGSDVNKATIVPVAGSTTASRTISGLKANTKYYFWIRTYKSVTGEPKPYYSGWSSKKSAKTKKAAQNSNSNSNNSNSNNSNSSNSNSSNSNDNNSNSYTNPDFNDKTSSIKYSFSFDDYAGSFLLGGKPITSYSYEDIKAICKKADKAHYEINTTYRGEECVLYYKGGTRLYVEKFGNSIEYQLIEEGGESGNYSDIPQIKHGISPLRGGWKSFLEPKYPGLYDILKDKNATYKSSNGAEVTSNFNPDAYMPSLYLGFKDGKVVELQRQIDSEYDSISIRLTVR